MWKEEERPYRMRRNEWNEWRMKWREEVNHMNLHIVQTRFELRQQQIGLVFMDRDCCDDPQSGKTDRIIKE